MISLTCGGDIAIRLLMQLSGKCLRHWWAAWTSNPVFLASTQKGGFDSHTLPPILCPATMLFGD